MNWRIFYAVLAWTNRFWAWGAAYTIVKGRHIGLDIGTGRRAVNVPALHAGRVALVVKTLSMGWVIYVDTGLPGARRYFVYCHMSGDRLPAVGQWIDRNERIGRLAAHGRDVPYSDIDYGGTAWDGIHLHLVMTDRLGGAHLLNTGAQFANPEDFIREALTGAPAAGGSRPFNPEEGYTMYADDPGLQARLDQIVGWTDGRVNDLAGLINANFEGLTKLIEASTDEQIAEAKSSIAEARNQLAGWTRDDANSLRAAINAVQVAGTDPAKIAEALVPLIPKGVSAPEFVDELLKRLARADG